MKGRKFIMNVRHFLNESWLKVENLLWMFEIFWWQLMTGWDFIMNGWDFLDSRSVFSCWQVRIFMMIGLDFNDNRSKVSWWQAENFMITGRDFHNDKSRFLWWQVEIYFCSWCYSRKQGRGVSLRFHFLFFGENQDN